VSNNTFIDVWRSTATATAVFLLLADEPSMSATVTGNRHVRGSLVVGTDIPAGSAVNDSGINGTASVNVTVTEQGNAWTSAASFAGSVLRQQGSTRNRVIAEGTAAPTTGTWNRGDQVIHTLPVAGGNVGWVCVNGGTPGTWRSFGTIAT
jgi:hypothetical protein